MKGIAKYNSGDEVLVIKSKEKGIVKSVISELDNGNSLYLVDVDGIERMYAESYLELINKSTSKDDSNVSLNESLKDVYKVIVDELSLTNNKDDEIKNALKLAKYLAIREDINYDIDIKDNIKGSKLYKNLMSQENSYIVNSYLFSEILQSIGMDAFMIGLKDEDGIFYIANLVLIGDKYYYFDNTLEREIYLDNCSNPDEFMWCSSAVGKDSYEQFFKPVGIIAVDKDFISEMLPKNISVEDYDIDEVIVD